MIYFSRTVILTIHQNSKWSLNILKQPCRFFGGLDISPSSVMRNAEVQTIYNETVKIHNHGRLELRCPFNLYVTPIHQNDFPRLDRAFFTIYGDSGFQFSKEVWNKLFTFSTLYNAEDRTLRIVGQFTQLGEKQLSDQAHTLEVYCQIPPHYELDVNCSDNNNVNVEDLQCPRVHIQTKRGECSLKDIIADSIVVHSQSGNITCSGSLHGTIDLSTKRDGIIKASKLQGGFVRLKVENSDIQIRSLYSEHFLIQGQCGYFRLGNLYERGIVDLNRGSINIASIDGDGNVEIGVIDTSSVRLNLVGKRVQVSENTEHIHMHTRRKDGIVQVQGFISDKLARSTINVNASKGTIEFNVRDWFSTLKLDQHVDQ